MGLWAAALNTSSEDAESQVRDQVEQDNANFEQRHPGIVNGIKRLAGKREPAAMQAKNPVGSRRQRAEPPY
jgi:hypothetical protein